MSMARILVNAALVETEAPEGRPLLDFVREELGLRGTKEGCREGDCGACAVIIGEFHEGKPRYRAHPSCLAFVGELEGRHLVTIEGLAAAAEERGLEMGLTPVMKALLEENGSQCGFCSPGFVTSLTAWLLEGSDLSEEGAVKAIDGNLCRCTGYASIRRAARLLIAEFSNLSPDPIERIARLVERGVVPASTLAFASSEASAARSSANAPDGSSHPVSHAAGGIPVGGGSDLAIKNPSAVFAARPRFLRNEESLNRITREGENVIVGAATSVRDFFGSPLVREAVPGIGGFESRFASTLVRNRATVGGNVANASPIADLTPILLALGAEIRIVGPTGIRVTRLDGFFMGYRSIDLRDGEIIAAFVIPRLAKNDRFNFEKLSKRENLDIATVNTAAWFKIAGDSTTIVDTRISAGGVAPIPLILRKTSDYLRGKSLVIDVALGAADLAAKEVRPIGDVRGSASYRGEGLRRLILAHFAALRPELAQPLAERLKVDAASIGGHA
ncbi:MAG TPA: FAD binding domain-containing protein [Rectinemataceae bacterium]|nr:FAD binding domain-containing protein [Rectinemataceae bacterium]